MDVLTASIALILVQLSTALVMTGIYRATPSESCTRYWALSGFSVAVGVLLIVLNGGAPNTAILLIGNNLLILGLGLQWRGIRAFYRRPAAYAGWVVCAAFFLSFAWLLYRHATVGDRALLSSLAVLALLLLEFREVIGGSRGNSSFASALTLGALAVLIVAYVVRVVGAIVAPPDFFPGSGVNLSISVIYMVPTMGGLLLWCGLLLLYFERIVAEKHELVIRDELTGLLNRRAINAAGERQIRFAARMKLPLTVAFVDIDHFKRINDTLGHAGGDVAVARVAALLQHTCRNVDLVGRYGGDEFCIIFPGLDTAAASAVGERLVQAVRHEKLPGIGRVTISVGLAVLTVPEALAWNELLRRADSALYLAKQQGRDCFIVDGAVPQPLSAADS
jgi:diguanylate cyclase (GGDEF)-like protein